MAVYLTATIVPIADPHFCKKDKSPIMKTLFFITIVRNFITVFVGNVGSDKVQEWMKSESISRPWLVSVYVYIDTASAIKSFAVLGSCSISFTSFSYVNESF